MVQFVGIETPDPTKGRQRYPTTPQTFPAATTQQDFMSTPKGSSQQQYQYSRSQNSPVRTPFASGTPTPANNANAAPTPTPIPTINIVEDEAPPTAWLEDSSSLGTPMRKDADVATTMPAGANRFDTTSKLLRTPRVAVDAEADPMANWVIVYGFHQQDTKSILRKFSEYGTIVRQTAGRRAGNWMCLEYSTRMQAEKALCQSGTFHSADSLIGVRRADPKTVKEIGIDLHGPRGGVDDLMADGSVFGAGSNAFTSNKNDTPKTKDSRKTNSTSDKPDYDDILLRPKPRSNIIEKVLAWVFTW